MTELHSEPRLCFLCAGESQNGGELSGLEDGDREPRCGHKGEGSKEGLERPWEERSSVALRHGWAEDRSENCFVISLLCRQRCGADTYGHLALITPHLV